MTEAERDDELYAQLSTRPDHAFKKIYDRYSGPLFRYLYRFTMNREAAEEILHDVFLQLLGGKYAPKTGSTLKSWLYVTAKNRGLNYLKKSSFEIKDGVAVEGAVDSRDVSQQIDSQGLLAKLALAETALPPDLQETWGLKKQGLDHRQIAAALAIPIGTVKSRFSRLVAFMRKEFQNEQ